MSCTNLPPSVLCQEGTDPSSDPGKPNQMFSHQIAHSFWGSSHQKLLQLTGPIKKKHTLSSDLHTLCESLVFSLCGDIWLYLFLQSCPSNDLSSNCSKVWVKFKSDELGVRGKQAGDPHRGVATVGSQLQHSGWVYLRHHWVKNTACGPKQDKNKYQNTQRSSKVMILHMKAHSHIMTNTFLIPHIHGPLLVSAEIIDGFDYAARVSSSGVLLYCTQDPLKGSKKQYHFTIGHFYKRCH